MDTLGLFHKSRPVEDKEAVSEPQVQGSLPSWALTRLNLIKTKDCKGRGQLKKKKRFLSGIARIMGVGGVYPCPNFLALFLEVHFWSIKRVYFFKNANVLNF